jgi:hypothetical protein
MLHQEGLLDVFRPLLNVACPCVFNATGWAQRQLLAKEILHAFVVPLNMDEVLLAERRAQGVLQRSITPIVVLAIFCSLWSDNGGGDMGSDVPQQRLPSNDKTGEEMDKGGQDVIEDQVLEEQEEHHEVIEEVEVDNKVCRWASSCPQLTNGPFRTWTRWEAEIGQLTEAETDQVMEADTGQLMEPLPREPIEPSPLALFAKLKQEHDLAKAVKSDDAEVHIDLWDQAVCKGPPSDAEKMALTTIRGYMLRRYQQRLWLDAGKYLQNAHGMDWVE